MSVREAVVCAAESGRGEVGPGRDGRVVVGMSGGVDSSVAAALLVERGYQVIGITMALVGSEGRCRSAENAADARRVADHLGIRFHVADYTDRFRQEVVEPFADAYLSGRTPIPCVVCNQRFKFHRLLERGRVLGASAVATGHYARIDTDACTGERRLLRARDSRRDQSYFLFKLGPEQLRSALFPLGGLTKSEVREKARALGLATAERASSQEICFAARHRLRAGRGGDQGGRAAGGGRDRRSRRHRAGATCGRTSLHGGPAAGAGRERERPALRHARSMRSGIGSWSEGWRSSSARAPDRGL